VAKDNNPWPEQFRPKKPKDPDKPNTGVSKASQNLKSHEDALELAKTLGFAPHAIPGLQALHTGQESHYINELISGNAPPEGESYPSGSPVGEYETPRQGASPTYAGSSPVASSPVAESPMASSPVAQGEPPADDDSSMYSLRGDPQPAPVYEPPSYGVEGEAPPPRRPGALPEALEKFLAEQARPAPGPAAAAKEPPTYSLEGEAARAQDSSTYSLEGEGEGAEAVPSPKPKPGPTGPTSGAAGWGDLAGGIGWAFGATAGGPLGGAFGQLGGRLLGHAIGGGKVDAGDVLKSAGALAGGAIFGKAGAMIGAGVGRVAGDAGEGDGQAEGAVGPATVGGANDGGFPEMIRLLREVSINIKSLVGDGILIRGDHRRVGATM